MTLDVVVLAAGQGTRMRSDLPKVMHPLAGKSMLAHVLETVRKLSPASICVVVGHGADKLRSAFAFAPDLTFVHQAQQLGTGHAVAQAVSHLANAVGSQGDREADRAESNVTLVLYGDVPLVQAATLQNLLRVRQEGQGGLALLTQTLDDPSGYGRIERNAQGLVQGIVEHKDACAAQRSIREINTGILAAPTRRLSGWLSRLDKRNAQGEYYLTDIVGMAVADGVAVHTAQPAQFWETLGVNDRTQQAELERIWQGEQARALLARGVTLADPSRFDLRGSLQCGRDVFIDVGCVFEGDVVLADGVCVGPHCVIRDAHIAAHARVDAFSHIEQASIGEHARIGPYARLRPGADIGSHAHIGNFVEIKQSRVGARSKASHLAYIGDAQVGERVNIGAGTITCNYDGANKHCTVIEDDAFIGSDSQLIAPVTVGKGATLGAGTTLGRDAPAGKLTLSRSRQTTVEGWVRPEKKGEKKGKIS